MKPAFLAFGFLVLFAGRTEAQTSPEAPWADVLGAIKARSIGPTNMGGRIQDLAVYEAKPQIFYIATASGGLWKTENGGITVRPVFDKEGTVSLGACAVSQKNPDLVWVGTGEGSSRNSVAWGDGVYKSVDGGKTWQNMGLKETMHIARVVIDPRDENTVYVGALGRLWGPNPERGVYKTTDGGKTWKQILKVDDTTGVADLDMNPKNPNELICAMWTRMRKAYDFTSGGPGSAIYKTKDGGKSWSKLTKGIPEGTLGRVGLTYFPKDPKKIFATVEYKPKAGETRSGDMNGGGTFISHNGGESWERSSGLNPRPFYFSHPQWDPTDVNRIYVLGVSFHMSDDMGKTYRAARANMHPDHHAIWIDPKDNSTMIVGNDGGVYLTRDRGANWQHINNIVAGQFYAVHFDFRKPYWVYGGLQDNGSWGYPTNTTKGGISFSDAYNVGGGDGFHVQCDPNDWSTLYTESQGGFLGRIDQRTGASRSIRPRAPQGERYRFNWSTPILLSPHNSSTIFMGGNKLFKSVNRGEAWKAISPDVTTNNPEKQKPGANSVSPENTGAEAHCTIVTISESPLKQGLIYVGTDDGLVWATQDDGANWTNLTANIPDLPANTWCSRVTASKWSEGRVYATFDGHRANDFKPYVYSSDDYGKTWTKLNNGLPDFDSVYVIREGTQNPDLLMLGSEMSLRISLDRGKTWARFRNDFPTVAVHDIQIHPRDLDAIIGTHGRSIWIMDVSALEQLTSENMAADVFLCRPQPIYNLGRVPGAPWDGDAVYLAPNSQPGANISYWLKNKADGSVKVQITDVAGRQIVELNGTGNVGLNSVRWSSRNRPAGEYRVVLKVGSKEYVTSVRIEDAQS